MPKKALIGVNNVARNIKQIYIGVNNVARKVKRAYIGVSGIARIWWDRSVGTLSKAADADPLSLGRSRMGNANTGNVYTLFAFGGISGGNSNRVDYYSASLVHSYTTVNPGRFGVAGASIGNYAIFGGGNDYNQFAQGPGTNYVNAFDTNITASVPTALGFSPLDPAGANNPSYAFIAGGSNMHGDATSYVYNNVEAYNANLVKTAAPALSQYKALLAGASVGNYAIIAGGNSYSLSSWNVGTNPTITPSNTVEAYDTNLVKTTAAALSVARAELRGARNRDFALFGGGNSNAVDAYDANLVHYTPTGLSSANGNIRLHVGASTGGYAIFCSGVGTYSTDGLFATAYDINLTRYLPTPVTVQRQFASGGSIANYALIAGGSDSSGAYPTTVEVYQEI